MTEELGPLSDACIKLRRAMVYAEMARDSGDPTMVQKQVAVAICSAQEALVLLKRMKGTGC